MKNPVTSTKHLTQFVEIIKKLRAPEGGCPWDLEQTHESLKPFLIEETYEVLNAIDGKNPDELKDELGDLLLQIFLLAQIASDEKKFSIEDVAQTIGEKMRRRHPHVFGNTRVDNAQDVAKNWEDIKKTEKSEKGITEKSLLDSIPANFPALFETHKIGKKAAGVGFDWQHVSDIYTKIAEELRELAQAMENKNQEPIEEEIGDLLFTAGNLARLCKINPELALKKANNKFRTRFKKMEEQIHKEKMDISNISFEKWNKMWDQAKKNRENI